MARNGHLSALSTGAIAAPEGQVEEDADKALVTEGEKLELDAVLYSSDALDGDLGFPIVHDFSYAKSATPVFVMLPLDVISRDGQLQHVQALDVSLQTLKKIGVEGVMIDVWWGIVEREGPGLYDWKAYVELLRMRDLPEKGKRTPNGSRLAFSFPSPIPFQTPKPGYPWMDARRVIFGTLF